MKHHVQLILLKKLEGDVLAATDKIRGAGDVALQRLWNVAQAEMHHTILTEYMHDFKRQKWNFVLAVKKGTLSRITTRLRTVMSVFHDQSQRLASHYLRETYRTSVLRNAWMLDNLTPPKLKVRLPQSKLFHESIKGATEYKGPNVDTSWKTRWASWNEAYTAALEQNLKLGAINESTPGDASDEVEATRAGTPASFLGDALARIFTYQSLGVAAQGQADITDANPDMGVEQVWMTRDNARVCDICDSNRGLTPEEVQDTIPAHPYCECYWRMVPRAWADLLRSGDVLDQELARRLDAAGKVPHAMLLDDGQGGLTGAVVVSYDKWVEGQPISITTGSGI